ncbi:MAG: LysE family translocator [Burkholderiaceae bacterium]|nr:LysE family translocator [Burkholderiaceae bacterium]
MLFYMVATAAGLSALFDAVSLAYDIVRYTGAAYLLWLAAKALWATGAPIATVSVPSEPIPLLFRRGFTTCLLNPKIVLMYGSLLPQFVHPDAGNPLVQTLELGILQIAAAALAHSCVILSASRITALLGRSQRFVSAQRYLLASLLVGVALRIAFDKRHVA